MFNDRSFLFISFVLGPALAAGLMWASAGFPW